MSNIKVSFIINATLVIGILELSMYLATISIIIWNIECTLVPCILVMGMTFKFMITLYDLMADARHHDNSKKGG